MAKGRRTAGWVGVVLVLFAACWGIYQLFERLAGFGPELEGNQFLLPALSLTLVVLALVLVGVLVRNLVRLIVDRKRGILGSRLRTKLVFFFLALVLLPASILFTGSVQVIKQSVEAMLRTPLEELTRQFRDSAGEWSDHYQGQSLRRATAIAGEIARGQLLDPGERARLKALLEMWGQQDDGQVLSVSVGGRLLAETDGLAGTSQAASRGQLDTLARDLSEQVSRDRQAASTIDYLGEGLLALAASPIEGREGGIVSVAIVLPNRLAAHLEGIVSADRAYRQFRIQRRALVRVYVTVIGLIFLVTLFIATWIGLYLARRITEPIQELAAASREISAGNLSVRVRTEAGDEMGTLVEAFNEMTAELQENRAVITRSTADLRRSNRALDERRRYIETLLANLSTAVISLDSDGRVTTANPAAEEILGVRLAAGDDAQLLFRDHDLHPLAEAVAASANLDREGVRRDLGLTLGEGSLNVSVQVSPLHGGGDERLGTLVMVEDLTELLRAQKAAAWREIARRIAHEIKNPLTPIQLAAQRLRKRFSAGADLDQVLPEATDSIEREVGALKRLVDEFSRFARMPEVALCETEFREVFDSVLALYKSVPGIQWRVDLQPDVGTVTLDPEQIRRVLINLIDNAVAAMGGRGSIELVAGVSDDGRMRVEISDSGPGIPPQDRDKMFSPYFSTKKRGTGLGLAIVHKVVTDHHGTIRVEENQPQGARFIIEIPAGGVQERQETWP